MTDSAISPDRGSSFKWTERKAKRINILFYWLKLTLGGSGHSTNEWKRNKEENKSYGDDRDIKRHWGKNKIFWNFPKGTNREYMRGTKFKAIV